MKKYFSLFFFVIPFFFVTPQNNIKFIYYNIGKTNFTGVVDIYPINLYSKNITEEIITDYEKPYMVTAGRIISIKTDVLEKIIKEKGDDVIHIFIIPDCPNLISKGGRIILSDVMKVVFIKSNYSSNELLHELGHSMFLLDDEYGGDDFSPVIKPSKIIRNVSYKNYVEEWENIKEILNDEDIGYYEGGMGFNKGVYRPYKDCLMRNLDSKLCPICFYYVISTMNNLTGLTVDFLESYKLYKR